MTGPGRYREQTVRHMRDATRRLVEWVREAHPATTSFDQMDRVHAEAFLTALSTATNSRTGKLLAISTVKDTVARLARMFADVTAWAWEGAPSYPLITRHDIPRLPKALPRYIPKDQLEQITDAIRELENPYQRAALLTARWTGARRDEIRRLELDSLEFYSDGHPRLRIPAGKTRRERTVPLHPEAAEALQALIKLGNSAAVRPRYDPSADRTVRYLFSRLGRLPSSGFLFDDAIRRACKRADLLYPDGRPMITMHRFRHSVGTALAEGGAQLHTIMAVLGHSSPAMSMVYASVADPIVRNQYEEIIERNGPVQVLAGPAADALRANQLDESAVHWLKTNFIKTELELGHCLRTPAEGPCECDLMLSCSKFLTTREYLPRLRQRCDMEDVLAQEAVERGRDREVERHTAIKSRLERLISDLEERHIHG
jgi:integrase